ncbi:MAG: aminotransferase class I/II-fold pyridoxal phosphate-dependent enzyme [Pseudomonadota bacterium]
MDVLARANALRQTGVDVAYLCVGQPEAPAPKKALAAARAMLDSGTVGYTDANGRLDLRNALAEYHRDRYGLDINPQHIVVTTGSSAGFNLAFLSLFDPGDRVAIAAPGYPAYRNILKALSLEVVEIETDESTRWALTPEMLAREHAIAPLKGVLVASPANPSGTMMTPDALQALVQACSDMNIRFISDEIYHGLTYPEDTGIEECSAARFSDDVIIINSFSKYFCMTGWRVGWMILPEDVVRPVERLAQSLYISAPELSQVAARYALDCKDELEIIRQGYRKNRTLLLERLSELGFKDILPVDGAFYAYADCSSFTNDSMHFAHKMLDEAHVAVTPGIDFDPVRGHSRLRFSFAGSTATMQTALGRLESWLK